MAHLFIGQLPFARFYDKDLRDLFEPFGTILTATLVRRNGEAFITFEHTYEADLAIRVLHDQYIMPGRKNKLQVMYARGSVHWSWFGIQHNIYLYRKGKGKIELAPFFSYLPPLSASEHIVTVEPRAEPILLTMPIADARHRGVAGPLGEVFSGVRHAGTLSCTQSSASTLSSTTNSSDLFSGDTTNSSSSSTQSTESHKSRSGSKRTRSMRDAEEDAGSLDEENTDAGVASKEAISSCSQKKSGGRSFKKKKKKMRVQDEENIEVDGQKSPTPEPVCVQPKLITKLFIGPPRHHHNIKLPVPGAHPLVKNRSVLGRSCVTDPAEVSSRMSFNNPYSALPEENTQAQRPATTPARAVLPPIVDVTEPDESTGERPRRQLRRGRGL